MPITSSTTSRPPMGANGIVVETEVQVDAMPLHRVPLGEHFNRGAAEEVFAE